MSALPHAFEGGGSAALEEKGAFDSSEKNPVRRAHDRSIWNSRFPWHAHDAMSVGHLFLKVYAKYWG
jgi:hypothetical protein